MERRDGRTGVSFWRMDNVDACGQQLFAVGRGEEGSRWSQVQAELASDRQVTTTDDSAVQSAGPSLHVVIWVSGGDGGGL
jgi:hypothetical protein